MSKTETKTYTWSCDLCGTEVPEEDLDQVYGEQTFNQMLGNGPQVDICLACRKRPISDVLVFLYDLKTATRRTPVVIK